MNNLEKHQAIFDAEPQIEIAVRAGKTCGHIARILGFQTGEFVRLFLKKHRPDLYEIAKLNGTRAQKAPHRNADPSQLNEQEKAFAQHYAAALNHSLGARRACKEIKVTESTWSRWRRGQSSPSRALFDRLQSVYEIYCSEVNHGPTRGDEASSAHRVLPAR